MSILISISIGATIGVCNVVTIRVAVRVTVAVVASTAVGMVSVHVSNKTNLIPMSPSLYQCWLAIENTIRRPVIYNCRVQTDRMNCD